MYALTDEAGAIAEAVQSYDSYGKISALITGAGSDATWFTSDDVLAANPNVSTIGNTFFYTGQRVDPETGLYYYKNRYYSAELGRFVSRDPLGFGRKFRSLYALTSSRPTRYLDSQGLEEKCCQFDISIYLGGSYNDVLRIFKYVNDIGGAPVTLALGPAIEDANKAFEINGSLDIEVRLRGLIICGKLAYVDENVKIQGDISVVVPKNYKKNPLGIIYTQGASAETTSRWVAREGYGSKETAEWGWGLGNLVGNCDEEHWKGSFGGLRQMANDAGDVPLNDDTYLDSELKYIQVPCVCGGGEICGGKPKPLKTKNIRAGKTEVHTNLEWLVPETRMPELELLKYLGGRL
ncbi:MAG: RHS repeat-associated core domain-containing protein [Planctomycetes bacterium]|nr:RHS repeat-associated core domain-containing protein [Planctomycetota bacterium]